MLAVLRHKRLLAPGCVLFALALAAHTDATGSQSKMASPKSRGAGGELGETGSLGEQSSKGDT